MRTKEFRVGTIFATFKGKEMLVLLPHYKEQSGAGVINLNRTVEIVGGEVVYWFFS